jgi:catechol 2,3-dioxygenase-like lactoylglutathione lyase family enzyme
VITGAHCILYSTDADADREFFREVLEFPHVDAGDGWLIFRLPPSEVAVHPSDENGVHEVYLTTDDVDRLVATLAKRGVRASPVADRGWGLLTQVILPGGGTLGIYEPRHPSPPPHGARRGRAKAKAKAPRKKPARAVARRARGRPARR